MSELSVRCPKCGQQNVAVDVRCWACDAELYPVPEQPEPVPQDAHPVHPSRSSGPFQAVAAAIPWVFVTAVSFVFVVVGLVACLRVSSSGHTVVALGVTCLGIVGVLGTGLALRRQLGLRSAATSACSGFARAVHGVREDDWIVQFCHRGIPARLEVRPPETINFGVSVGFGSGAPAAAGGPKLGNVLLTFELPRPLPRLSVVAPQGVFGRLNQAIANASEGLHQVTTGDPVFDRRFLVAAEDVQQAVWLLSSNIRKQVAELGPYAGFYTDGSRLVIGRVITEVPPAPGLKAFCDCAGYLFDLLAAQIAGTNR